MNDNCFYERHGSGFISQLKAHHSNLYQASFDKGSRVNIFGILRAYMSVYNESKLCAGVSNKPI